MQNQDTQTPVAGPESGADGVSTDSGTPGTPDASQGLREARDRYRAERDSSRETLTALQARFEQLQRAEVERVASSALAMGSDLFTLTGNELSDYLTESGDVDRSKVEADVAAVLAERPGLRKNSPAFDPSQGTGGNVTAKSRPGWGDLMR